MAGGLQNRHGGGRRNAYRPMAEINVTPMVDVMLVLLIVFMVAAPLLTVGVPVDLPKTEAKSLNDQNEVLSVAVKADGQIYINDNSTAVTDDDLVPKLQAIVQAKPDSVIYVRGDKGVNYGRVMEVMGLVSSAGFSKVSLIAELPAGGRKH
jgi:biopolymer transport protein TolR